MTAETRGANGANQSLRVAVVSSPVSARAARLLGGLGYSVESAGSVELVAANPPPDVVVVSSPADADLLAAPLSVVVTPWGRGERADWPASDHVVAAAGGWSGQIGMPDGPPTSPPNDQAWSLTAVATAIAVLTYGRPGTGESPTSQRRVVEIAAVDVVAATLEVAGLSWIHDARNVGRPGRRHPLVAHELAKASDGWIATGLGGNESMWQRLREWLVGEGITALDDDALDDPHVRADRRDEVAAAVAEFCATRPRLATADEAQRRRLPWAAVLTSDEVAASPQFAARGFDLAAPRVPWIITPGPPPDCGGCAGESERSERPGDRAAKVSGAPAEDAVDAASVAGERNIVIDLTWVLAGPFGTRILADHGADVIKIESQHRPDPTRFAPIMHLGAGEPGHGETSGYFANHNRNKRSITLNLRTAEGQDVLRRLIAGADVVIDNFSAGTLQKWGLGPDQLWQLRDDLVIVEMSGTGQSGPWSRYVSYADAVSSLSGLTAATTDPEGEAMGVVFGLADLVAGYHGALAVVAALAERRRTGRGAYVDLAQLEAMAYNLWGFADVVDHRDDVEDTHLLAADEVWVAVSAPAERLADHRRRAAELAGDQLAAAIRAAGDAAAVVADGECLVTTDTAVREVPFYVTAEHPFVAAPLVEADPIIVDGARPPIRRSAPLLGADTDDVLATIAGMTDDEIAAARASGALT